MQAEYLYRIDTIWILFFSLMILALLIEIGYRRGRTSGDGKDFESLITLIPTSLLGVLALLMGFTFSMAISRFEARKAVLVREANSIETTWLRTDLLKSNEASTARAALIDYLDHRIKFPSASSSPEVFTAYQNDTSRLQAIIWKTAVEESLSKPTPVAALFMSSVNEMIDLSTERLFAWQDHVPSVAYIIIFALAMASHYELGFLFGARQYKRSAPLLLAFMFCLVLTLIQDIDRPSRGLVTIRPHLMLNLRQSLTKPSQEIIHE